MTQAMAGTAGSTLEEALYGHLSPELSRDGNVDPVRERLFDASATEIDVEELLQHYDGARLLLFSDDERVGADREYAAAYLASARPGGTPALALPYCSDGAIARALRARDDAPLEQATRVFHEALVREMGRALPAGLADLLEIALERGSALIGLGERGSAEERLERWSERLHAAALRGPVLALLPDDLLRPEWIERSFVRRSAYEVVAVWQSPPELYWKLRERHPEGELPQAVHLQSTWAFATLATHPVFRAAARAAAEEEDVLLPPRPAHSARRADAPMIEMLLGAAELVRTMVQPALPSPESVRVVSFLEPALETRLRELGLDEETVEATVEGAARGECRAFPEHGLVYLGQPRLALGLQAFVRVLVEPRRAVEPATAVGAREARYARIARGEALAFFASGLIAGKRLWPEDEEPGDPLAPRVLAGLDRLERALERSARGSLVPPGAGGADAECAARVGRFLGARLLVAVDSRALPFDNACALFDPRDGDRGSARARLLELARVALS